MKFCSLSKSLALILFFVIASTAIAQAASNASGLLFYAPFQYGTTPSKTNGSSELLFSQNVETSSGKSGNAAKVMAGQSQLVYDGPGNAYAQAGTANFYWRLDADPQGKSVTILNLSPAEKTDKERYILLSYVAGKFRLYLSAGSLGGQTLTSKPILVLPGQWHQLTLCWDQTFGAALLVDGELAVLLKKDWIYDGAIGSIGLGVSNNPGRPPVTTFAQSFDELRIYDRWLNDANLQKLMSGREASASELDVKRLISQRLRFYQWNRDNISRLPHLGLKRGAGLALRQASVSSMQSPARELFNGSRAVSWPVEKSTSDQTLRITMAENQSFDMVQVSGIGRLVLTRDKDKKRLFDFQSDTEILRSFMTPLSVNARELTLQALPPTSKDIYASSAAHYLQFFQLGRFPYEFDSSWQKTSLRAASFSEQSSEALRPIKQVFYSSDQQTLIAQEGTVSGEITIPAMHTFHIAGPSHSQDKKLDAVAMELKLLSKEPGFARVQLMDPENPLHFLMSVDVYLSDGVGTLRMMLDNRDVQLPQGMRPIISILSSENTTLDLAGSVVRYKWK